ncbi:hypothetical protein CRG98_011352 [Punica granatum]|uniref:CCHC-type domain-containing protein n=1 Tax=Punica granatum TaxID=22663 RepID=A0A2I0KID3_PUNGR|nr:hypothetical protein CRG98_011352 [Punica granatum]
MAGITICDHRRCKPHFKLRINLALSKAKQEKKSVYEYYSKLKSLCDELELYLNLPACTCDAGAQLIAHKEKEKVHQFLIGFNPDFSTIRSQILSMDTLSNVNRAHSMAAHDEAQRLVTQGKHLSSEVMGFATKIAKDFGGSNPNFINSNKGDFKARGRPFCDYCGRNGHHRANCYQLHGYSATDQQHQWSSKGNSFGQSRGGKFGASLPSVLQQRGMLVSGSDHPTWDSRASITRAAHPTRVWPIQLADNVSPINRPNCLLLMFQQATWRPKPKPKAMAIR